MSEVLIGKLEERKYKVPSTKNLDLILIKLTTN